MRLGGPTYGTGPSAVVRTGTDGRFTARLVAIAGKESGNWFVESPDRYVSFPDLHGALAIPLESRTDLRTYGLSADGRVTVSGTFRARYVPEPNFETSQFVRLEQLVGRDWKAIAWASVNSAYFNDFTLSAASKGGWFRVRHLTTDQFAESVTPSFRLTRLDTRIVSLNSKPRAGRQGQVRDGHRRPPALRGLGLAGVRKRSGRPAVPAAGQHDLEADGDRPVERERQRLPEGEGHRGRHLAHPPLRRQQALQHPGRGRAATTSTCADPPIPVTTPEGGTPSRGVPPSVTFSSTAVLR